MWKNEVQTGNKDIAVYLEMSEIKRKRWIGTGGRRIRYLVYESCVKTYRRAHRPNIVDSGVRSHVV